MTLLFSRVSTTVLVDGFTFFSLVRIVFVVVFIKIDFECFTADSKCCN
jgi:hypothetical protein